VGATSLADRRRLVSGPSGGRSWWAHFEFTRINIQLIILPEKFEDLREARGQTSWDTRDAAPEAPRQGTASNRSLSCVWNATRCSVAGGLVVGAPASLAVGHLLQNNVRTDARDPVMLSVMTRTPNNVRSDLGQSAPRTSIGLTEDARRAGIQLARSAEKARTAVTITSVGASACVQSRRQLPASLSTSPGCRIFADGRR